MSVPLHDLARCRQVARILAETTCMGEERTTGAALELRPLSEQDLSITVRFLTDRERSAGSGLP